MTLPAPERRWAHALFVVVGLVGVGAAAWALPQPVTATTISSTVVWCPDARDDVSRQLLTAYDWST